MSLYNNNRGISAPLVLSIFALMIALGATLLVIDAQTKIKTEFSAVYGELDTLLDIDTVDLAGSSGEIPALSPNPNVMTDEEYRSLQSDKVAGSVDKSRVISVNTTSNFGSTVSGEVNLNALYANAPSVVLENESGEEAIGKAWIAEHSGKTYVRVATKGLPDLGDLGHYEGWLAQGGASGQFFSVGKLDFNPSDKTAILSVETDGNYSSYREIWVSRQTDVQTIPERTLLAGKYSPEIAYAVTAEMMAANPGPVAPAPKTAQGAAVPSAAIPGGAALPGALGAAGGGASANMMQAILGKQLNGGAGAGAGAGAIPGLPGGLGSGFGLGVSPGLINSLFGSRK